MRATCRGTRHESGLSALGKKLTFQTIVAFVTFFGVGGLSAIGFGWSSGASLATAVVVGMAAMVLLAYAFGGLRRLQGSGTLRLSDAVGEVGRVYLRVPAGNGGVGKVTLAIQGRTEEIRAVTPGPELRSGEPIVVTRVLDGRTIEVVAEAAYLAKRARWGNDRKMSDNLGNPGKDCMGSYSIRRSGSGTGPGPERRDRARPLADRMDSRRHAGIARPANVGGAYRTLAVPRPPSTRSFHP